MQETHARNKDLIKKYRNSLYNVEEEKLGRHFAGVFASDAVIHMCSPLGDMTGPEELLEKVFTPLLKAIPDLERRDFIVNAGTDEKERCWVGCGGNYVGVFEQPWLDIPPTWHPVAFRFHEFFHIVDGKVIEMQAIWDIPHLMMQADAWPLAPSLGKDWIVPGPATQDGLSLPPRDEEESQKTCQLILDMLDDLIKYPSQPEEAMQMPRYWHDKMTWYGPGGIGTNRRISGFRNWHQEPFLKAMPDRGETSGLDPVFFGDGTYAACTGWPNMQMKLSGDGWMGIPPVNKELTMKSLDFWRREGEKIRENWVLVDIIDAYDQLGVDVFHRMRELTVARQVKRPKL